MKKSAITITIIITAVLTLAAMPAFSQDHKHGGHDMDHSGHDMDHSGHKGALIHESTVNGHGLAYHLIDMMEKMKGMKNMPEMKNTHHLMVYVKGPDGKVVDKAKVGYLLKGPGGADQKAMCMAMSGGFGSDVNLEKKGKYTIKTKIMAGGVKLVDSFEYEVK